MKLTDDVKRRCGDMLKGFADRNQLVVNVKHVNSEGRTEVTFYDPDHSITCTPYHILWNEVANLSEACAYIYADVICKWGLNRQNNKTNSIGEIGKVLHTTVERYLDDRFNIETVIFNKPATIVLWKDGTKTVVKCQDGDTYSKETGLALCIAKKALGNMPNFNNVFKKWIPEEPVPPMSDVFTIKPPTVSGATTALSDEIRAAGEKLLKDIRDAFKL